MKHVSLGRLDVSRIGLGTMANVRLLPRPGQQRRRIDPHHPASPGVGCHPRRHRRDLRSYANEELVGRALKGRRDQVVVATKFGLVSHAGAGPERSTQARRTSGPSVGGVIAVAARGAIGWHHRTLEDRSMTTNAFYTHRLAGLGGLCARPPRPGRAAWLLVLATVIAAAPASVPLHLQLIPDRGLS
jgi:hypothetical protein